jgi:hypothetical protein
MKKYLNKLITNIFKTKIFLFLIIFFISSVFSGVYAQSKLDYYKNLFGVSFGFPLSEEIKDLAPGVGYVPTNFNNGYLILLSSSISREETLDKYFLRNKKIILICDKPYTTRLPAIFSCDKSAVISNELEGIGGFLKRDNSQGTDLYVIPENLLVSPDERSNTEEYFKAFKRSDAVPLIAEDGDIVKTLAKKIDQVKVLFTTSTFETFGIALSVFLVVSLSFGFLKYLLGANKKKFSAVIFKKTLLKIRDSFLLHKWVIVYSLTVLTLMYIPIIITLGVKDGMGINFGYFISYSLDTFKISNLVSYIDQGVYFRVVIFFYNFIYLITLAALVVPSLITTFLIALPRIENAKLKIGVQKYVVPLIIIAAIIGSGSAQISDSYRFLIFTSVVLAFILLNNLKYKTFDYKYSSREKMLFISFAFLIIVGGMLLKFREKNIGPIYKNEDLIGIGDDIVTLPYSKQVGENLIFNNYLISISDPIFADRYLVYSPIYSRIENKNALEFKNSGSYFIQNGNLKEMVSNIYINEDLSNAMTLKYPSNFFKIKGFNANSGLNNAKINITFSCESEDIGINEIRSNYYYLNSDGEVKESDELLLHFPGCSKVGEPETYTVEFKPPYIESDSFFMRLIDVLGKDIKDIKVVVSDKVIQPTYYSKGRGYTVVASGGLTNSTETKIINYIFTNPESDFYDLSFDLDLDSEGKFNISKPINDLVKQGVLKDNFLIWSTKKYVPIRVGL